MFVPFDLLSLKDRGYGRVGLVCLGVLCFLPGTAWASGLEVETELSETGSVDSNPRMLTHGEKTLYGSTTTPVLILKAQTPTVFANVETSADVNQYDQSSYNSNDFHGKSDLTKRYELWQADLSCSADYDTARASELTLFGRDVGIVRHLGYRFSPQITYSMSPRDKISAGGAYAFSRYDSESLTDYSVATVNTAYARSLTPLHTGIFSVQAQRYQTKAWNNARIDSIGPSFGWNAQFSPELSLQISAGFQTSREEADDLSSQPWTWNYVFSGKMAWKSEQDDLSLSATRQRQPYANGTESLLTGFSVKDTHTLNDLFSLSVLGSYQYAQSPAQAGTDLNDRITGQTGLSYHVLENVDITASYKYRRETYTNEDRTAQQNVGLLTVVFRPDIGDLLD